MNEKLSLIASVSVIAIVLYLAWLIKDVNRSDVEALTNTIAQVSKTFGTPVPAVEDKTKPLILAAIAGLFGLTVYVLIKKQ